MRRWDLIITADPHIGYSHCSKESTNSRSAWEVYYKNNNTRQLLSMCNFMDELRGSGIEIGSAPSFG